MFLIPGKASFPAITNQTCKGYQNQESIAIDNASNIDNQSMLRNTIRSDTFRET